jgi:hypothetical protein
MVASVVGAHAHSGPQAKQVRHRSRAFGISTLNRHRAHSSQHPADITQQIGELKSKIQAEKGWEVPQQKLIYSGALASRHLTECHLADTGADTGEQARFFRMRTR